MRGEPVSGKRARASEAVCVILRAEARVGADENLAKQLAVLARDVRAKEAGCTSYIVTRMMGSREHFAVHAHFSSWSAFNTHAETSHLTRVLPRLAPLLATPISMEIFLETPAVRRRLGVDDAWREVEAKRQRK
jgi:quinol monooxygenase YgiN